MADGNSTLDERKRFTRRIPEETASEGAIGVVDEPFAEGVVERIGPLGAAEGRDAFRELPQRTRGAFPDLEAAVDWTVAESHHVARGPLSGTHRGEFVDVEPTGKPFEIEHAIFVRFADDETVESWGQLDAFEFRRQLEANENPAG